MKPTPEIEIGSKVEIFVKANVVVPAKVMTCPAFNPVNGRVLLLGQAISWRVTAVQAAIAGATCEKSVAVHGTGVALVVETDDVVELVTGSKLLLTEAEVLLTEVVARNH